MGLNGLDKQILSISFVFALKLNTNIANAAVNMLYKKSKSSMILLWIATYTYLSLAYGVRLNEK